MISPSKILYSSETNISMIISHILGQKEITGLNLKKMVQHVFELLIIIKIVHFINNSDIYIIITKIIYSKKQQHNLPKVTQTGLWKE